MSETVELLVKRRNKGLLIQVDACSCHPAEYSAQKKRGDQYLTNFAGCLDYEYEVKAEDYLTIMPIVRDKRLSAMGIPEVVDVPFKEVIDYLPKRDEDVTTGTPTSMAPGFRLPPTRTPEEEAAEHQRRLRALEDDYTIGDLKRQAPSSGSYNDDSNNNTTPQKKTKK